MNKSTVTSPAIVAILFLSAIVCVVALLWLPIKGIWWLYTNSRTAAHKQAVVVGQQWMQQVEEAFAPIPEEVVAAEPITGAELTVVAEADAVEAPIQGVSMPDAAVEVSSATQEILSLQQAIIEELRQLPTTKRRKAWTAICRHTNVSGGTKLRNHSLERQAKFLMNEQIPLHEIAKAVKTALAA
jgi:hypothetical protein